MNYSLSKKGGIVIKLLPFLFTIIISLSFLNCSSSNSVLTVDSKEEYEWYMGRQVATKLDSMSETTLFYEDNLGKYLLFYFSIVNLSDSSLQIDPAKFYLLTNNESFPTINTDQYLDKLKIDIEKAEDSHDEQIAVNSFVGLANLVASLWDGINGAGDAVTTFGDWFEKKDNEDIILEEKLDEINNLIEFWRSEALRKSTLIPEEEIGGYILFESMEGEIPFRIVIVLEGSTHIYSFKGRYQ